MKIIIHAPTVNALARARESVLGVHEMDEEAAVVIVANGEGATAAIDQPDPGTDRWLVLCEGTLFRSGLPKPTGIETTPDAVAFIAKLQRKGWSYCRA